MARVKRGVVARRRHKKVIGRAKGYYNARRKVYRVANQAVIKAGQYAYIGRKQKKRQFRSLWIVRINAAARQFGLSYSRLINGLSKAGITVDRKVLADIAVHDIQAFGAIAAQAQAALGEGSAKPAKVSTATKTTKAAEPAKKSKSTAKGDDLTHVEGVGPKIAEVLHAAGITSFADLAATDAERLGEILHGAGSQFASHDPTTWPQQAKLAAAGKFDELDALQGELQGGREDLTRIEGVGPKIAEVLHAAGIAGFAELAATGAERLSEILHEAGSQFASHDPATWPKQAKLAAAGKFDELDAMQDELNGGRAA